MALRVLTHLAVRLQSGFLDSWFVPSPGVQSPSQRPFFFLVERDIIWPLRQDVAGRIAGRMAIIAALGLAVVLEVGWEALPRSIEAWRPLILDVTTFAIGGGAFLAIFVVLAIVELILPLHVRRSMVVNWGRDAAGGLRPLRLGDLQDRHPAVLHADGD